MYKRGARSDRIYDLHIVSLTLCLSLLSQDSRIQYICPLQVLAVGINVLAVGIESYSIFDRIVECLKRKNWESGLLNAPAPRLVDPEAIE
jgi:hypothetical protein